MRIRKMEERDFDAVHLLFEQVHALHVENRPDVYRNTDPLPRARFEEMLTNESAACLVAEEEGVAVGICVLLVRAPSANPVMLPVRIAFIEDICVHRDFRRRGIGKALLEAAREAARSHGAETLMLQVWAFNEAALRFYEAAGMRVRSLNMEETL